MLIVNAIQDMLDCHQIVDQSADATKTVPVHINVWTTIARILVPAAGVKFDAARMLNAGDETTKQNVIVQMATKEILYSDAHLQAVAVKPLESLKNLEVREECGDLQVLDLHHLLVNPVPIQWSPLPKRLFKVQTRFPPSDQVRTKNPVQVIRNMVENPSLSEAAILTITIITTIIRDHVPVIAERMPIVFREIIQ